MSDTDQPDGSNGRTGSTPQQIADLIAATTDEPLVEGDEPISVWMLVKSRDVDGDVVWGVRNAGAPFSSEELLGALTGFTESLKRDLSSDWA